ncbi:hypothetical protein J6590_059627 [Homalodisca vitripennis]|nr:hypothetical protein J6590_059627 [Homalodisca vitripennis]
MRVDALLDTDVTRTPRPQDSWRAALRDCCATIRQYTALSCRGPEKLLTAFTDSGAPSWCQRSPAKVIENPRACGRLGVFYFSFAVDSTLSLIVSRVGGTSDSNPFRLCPDSPALPVKVVDLYSEVLACGSRNLFRVPR